MCAILPCFFYGFLLLLLYDKNKHLNVGGTTVKNALIDILILRKEIGGKKEEQSFYHLCNQYGALYLLYLLSCY